MPYKNGKLPVNATIWPRFNENFLKAKYTTLTNKELAAALGLRMTVTRNKLAELGLKRMELEYWPDGAKSFLISNYRTLGDVEIAENLERLYPKKKTWTKQHVRKKRMHLTLHRTDEEVEKIRTKNASAGGNAYTIGKNSGAVNLNDSWIASIMSRSNPKLKEKLLQKPEVLDKKRKSIQAKRLKKERAFKKQQITAARIAEREKKKLEREREQERKRIIEQNDKKKQKLLRLQEAERMTKKRKADQPLFKTLTRDYSQLITVRIDNKTIVYAKPGEDLEEVKKRYVKSYQMGSNWKFNAGNDK